MLSPAVLLVACLFSPPTTRTDARTDGATLIVNQVPVYTVRSSRASFTPNQRAQAAAAMLAKSDPKLRAEVKSDGKVWRVVVGKSTLLLFTPEEAGEVEGRRTASIAFANKLNGALALPPVLLAKGEERIVMAARSSRTVTLVGSEAARATVLVDNPSLKVRRSGAGQLTLSAIAACRGALTVECPSGGQSIEVEALPLAVELPQRLTAFVRGAPATPGAVRASALAAVTSRLEVSPSAELTIGTSFPCPSVGAGGAAKVMAPVSATAPGCARATGQVEVTVTNLGAGSKAEEELWYSNDPENLYGPCDLFTGQLHPSRPVRLLLHHQNRTAAPLIVQYALINRGATEARVAVTIGDGTPDPNPTLVGLNAGEEFLQGRRVGSASVVQIPPGTMAPLALRVLRREDTASGLATLELLQGGPSSVTLKATTLSPASLSESWRRAAYGAEPWACMRPVPAPAPPVTASYSRDVFPTPFRRESFAYEVGGRHAFIRVGEKAIPRSDQRSTLQGNFGVTYEVTGTVHNPRDRATEVELVFEASAGYAGALVEVGGKLIRVPLAQAKGERQVATYSLPAGATRHVRFTTIPLSGASYPVTFIVRESEAKAPNRTARR